MYLYDHFDDCGFGAFGGYFRRGVAWVGLNENRHKKGSNTNHHFLANIRL